MGRMNQFLFNKRISELKKRKMEKDQAHRSVYRSAQFHAGGRFAERCCSGTREQQKEFASRDEADACYPKLVSLLNIAQVIPGWYLRYGEPPESGRSSRRVPIQPGAEEKGVSVFDGDRTAKGHYVLKLDKPGLRISAASLFSFETRQAFFVRGRRIATGSSGEPVLGEIYEIEPVPREAIIAASPSSRALEDWNERRGGPLEERVPGLMATTKGD